MTVPEQNTNNILTNRRKSSISCKLTPADTQELDKQTQGRQGKLGVPIKYRSSLLRAHTSWLLSKVFNIASTVSTGLMATAMKALPRAFCIFRKVCTKNTHPPQFDKGGRGKVGS